MQSDKCTFFDANVNKFIINRDLRFMSLLMEEEESNVEFLCIKFGAPPV